MRPLAGSIFKGMSNQSLTTELKLYNMIMSMVMQIVGEMLGWGSGFSFTNSKLLYGGLSA